MQLFSVQADAPPPSSALLAKYTQRTEWDPSIIVNCGPLTLRSVCALSTWTRFVVMPSIVRSPGE